MAAEPEDFSQLDDVSFLAERARVRTELADQGDRTNRAVLERRYEAMTEEFLIRARIAWSA